MDLSVVIPVFNEAESLYELTDRLVNTLDPLGLSYEIILMDDGSTDGSRALIEQLHQKDARIQAIFLSRNFGHQIAITAGLHHVSGKVVAIMDGDLQDPPEILPEFWNKLKEGHDVVYGIRRKRKENVWKRLSYFLFYRFFNILSEFDIPLDSGDFCMMNRHIVDQLNRMPEHHRFLRGLRAWTGYRQVGIEYERAKRQTGEPQYTFSKLLNLALDGLISFSALPVRLIIQFGLIAACSSFVIGLFYLILRLLNIGTWPSGFATLILVTFFFGGIQLITIGIIGEYVGRIHMEVKNRPLYLVANYLGVKSVQESASQNPSPSDTP